jgi:hypothetical protein
MWRDTGVPVAQSHGAQRQLRVFEQEVFLPHTKDAKGDPRGKNF